MTSELDRLERDLRRARAQHTAALAALDQARADRDVERVRVATVAERLAWDRAHWVADQIADAREALGLDVRVGSG